MEAAAYRAKPPGEAPPGLRLGPGRGPGGHGEGGSACPPGRPSGGAAHGLVRRRGAAGGGGPLGGGCSLHAVPGHGGDPWALHVGVSPLAREARGGGFAPWSTGGVSALPRGYRAPPPALGAGGAEGEAACPVPPTAGTLGATAYTDDNVVDGGDPLLSAGAWAIVLADEEGRVLRVVTGAVAGEKTAPRVELHAALWVPEGAAGAVRDVTDCRYVYKGAATTPHAPDEPAPQAFFEGRDGEPWRRLGVFPPSPVRTGSHPVPWHRSVGGGPAGQRGGGCARQVRCHAGQSPAALAC